MSDARPPACGLTDRDPARSLEQYLAELVEQMNRLPLNDRRRGRLATRIREIEIQLDAGSGL